jgi:predicted nucleotidyltransferase
MPKPNSPVVLDILEALRVEPDLKLVILFGSLARGREQWESDIDLAIDTGRLLTASDKSFLIEAIAEKIGRPVDLVDLQTAGEPLLGQILRHGIRIFGNNTSYANLIRKHLFDAADFMPYRSRILEARRRAWIES